MTEYRSRVPRRNGPTKIVIALAAFVFVAMNVWAFAPTPPDSVVAFLNTPMVALGEVIPSHRWATVAVADLVLGWLLFSILIWRFEARRWAAVLWILGIVGIGNLVAAIYVLLRLDRIFAEIDRDRRMPRSAELND